MIFKDDPTIQYLEHNISQMRDELPNIRDSPGDFMYQQKDILSAERQLDNLYQERERFETDIFQPNLYTNHNEIY